jgi:hypothetical protein
MRTQPSLSRRHVLGMAVAIGSRSRTLAMRIMFRDCSQTP